MRAACSAHHILLEFIRLLFGGEYVSSSLCSCLNPPVISFASDPNLVLSTVSLFPSLNIKHQASYPYKIFITYILIFRILESKNLNRMVLLPDIRTLVLTDCASTSTTQRYSTDISIIKELRMVRIFNTEALIEAQKLLTPWAGQTLHREIKNMACQ